MNEFHLLINILVKRNSITMCKAFFNDKKPRSTYERGFNVGIDKFSYSFLMSHAGFEPATL